MANERLMKHLAAPRGRCSVCGRWVTAYLAAGTGAETARRHSSYASSDPAYPTERVWDVCAGSYKPIAKSANLFEEAE